MSLYEIKLLNLKKQVNVEISVFVTDLHIHWKHKYANMLVFQLILHKRIL